MTSTSVMWSLGWRGGYKTQVTINKITEIVDWNGNCKSNPMLSNGMLSPPWYCVTYYHLLLFLA